MITIDDFSSCKSKDDKEFDYFSCQYFQSMQEYNDPQQLGYWFGRMITYNYSLEDIVPGSGNFSEISLRSGLQNGDIDLHGYTLLNVQYTVDPTDATKAVATGQVELDITINGNSQTITRNFTHQLKQTWHAIETTFS